MAQRQFTTSEERTMFDQFSKQAFRKLNEMIFQWNILSDIELKRTGQDFIIDGTLVPSYLKDTLINNKLHVETTARKEETYNRFVGGDMPLNYFDPDMGRYFRRMHLFANIPERRYKILRNNVWIMVDLYSICMEFPYPEILTPFNIDECVELWYKNGALSTIWKHKDILFILERDGEGRTTEGDDCVKMPLEYRIRMSKGVIIPEISTKDAK